MKFRTRWLIVDILRFLLVAAAGIVALIYGLPHR